MINNKTILIILVVTVLAAVGFVILSENSSPPNLTASISDAVEDIGEEPVFISVSADPQKVKVGDTLIITAEIQDKHGIAKVTALMPHERGADEIHLSLISGGEKNGKYQGKWKCHDTINIEYITTITATNTLGKTATKQVSWWDDTETVWWHGGEWSKRKKVTITGSTAGAQTNYQVKVTVAYDSDMQSDFSDIRFAKADETLLDHWLESKTNDSTADFWVEIDSIPASPGTVDIYFYYGNSGASSASNGTNTFLFFDDFDVDSDSDYEIKEDGAQDDFSYDGTNDRISVDGIRGRDGVSSYYLEDVSQNTGWYVSIKGQLNLVDNEYDNVLGIWLSKEKGNVAESSATRTDFYTNFRIVKSPTDFDRTQVGFYKDGSHTNEMLTQNNDLQDNEILVELWATSGTMRGKITRGAVVEHDKTHSHTVSLSDINYIIFGDLMGYPNYASYTTASTGWMDEFRVRKYAATEPSVGAASGEESIGGFGTYPLRKKITFDNQTPSANYQVKVILTTALMGNPYTNVQTDGDDIRFCEADGTNLDYWIETWSATGNSTLWVEVASSSTSVIYMYYGNPSASSASNGGNTFLFFDDFEDGDVSDWTVTAPSTVTADTGKEGNYSLKFEYIETGSVDTTKSTSLTGDWIYECWFKPDSVTFGKYQLHIYGGGNNGLRFGIRSTSLYFWYDSSYHDSSGATLDWHFFKVIFHSSTKKYDIYVDGNQKFTDAIQTGTPRDTFDSIKLGINTYDHPENVDTIKIRKYAATEPSVDTIGVEEKRSHAPGASPSGGGVMMF